MVARHPGRDDEAPGAQRSLRRLELESVAAGVVFLVLAVNTVRIGLTR